MDNVTIYTNGEISVGSVITGYRVTQGADKTRVTRWHNNGFLPQKNLGDAIQMPQSRYALSTESGRAQFNHDFLKLYRSERLS
jgi:hypothetical protein